MADGGSMASSSGGGAAVSYLFVPGSRADRFEKALASGADRVIIDLEDAVDVAEKDEARRLVCEALSAGLSAPVLIRLNTPGTPWFDEDLRALAEVIAERPGGLAGVVVPKLESGDAVERVREELCAGARTGEFEIIGLVESAAGVQAVDMLAAAGVARLAVGAVDLSVDLGTEVYSPVLDHIYSRVVLASRIAGIGAPIGSPPLDLRAVEAIETEARRLKSMGIGGQLCIHPAQVPAVRAGFAPTEQQVDWARRVLASEGGSVQVDGQMVDKPVRDRAERIVELAERDRA